jgi:cytochrome c-type biogenesis protein
MTEVSTAVTAGMLAVVNPCGLTLLPAYLVMSIVGDASRTAARRPGDRRVAAGRAVASGAAVAVGFVGVFGLLALLLGPVAEGVLAVAPVAGFGFGLLLVLRGIGLVAGRLPGGRAPASRRGVRAASAAASGVAFGAGCALVSTACAIGPFLAVVASAVRSGAAVQGGTLFAAYTVGVGLVVGVVAVVAALVRSTRRGRPVAMSVASDPDAAPARPRGTRASRAAGPLLMACGGYLAWYGWYALRLRRGPVPPDVIIAAGERLQHTASSLLTAIGAPRLAVLLVMLLVPALVIGSRRRRA